jgi:hypothetical protein
MHVFYDLGEMADELHDRIDEILEEGSDDWLRILTTSHMGKTAEDVSVLLFTATLPGNPVAHYLAIGDRSVEELQRVITSSALRRVMPARRSRPSETCQSIRHKRPGVRGCAGAA